MSAPIYHCWLEEDGPRCAEDVEGRPYDDPEDFAERFAEAVYEATRGEIGENFVVIVEAPDGTTTRHAIDVDHYATFSATRKM